MEALANFLTKSKSMILKEEKQNTEENKEEENKMEEDFKEDQIND